MTHHRTTLDAKRFAADPCVFLDTAIKEYVAVSPLNCLSTYNNAPFFDEPVVAFADGDDAIFQDFKTIIGDFHFTPREAFEMHVRSKGWKYGLKDHIEHVGVISYALPIPYETRISERRTPYGGSRRYNHTRWRGETFFRSLSHYVSSILEAMGYHALAPSHARFFERKEISGVWMANWQERHVAYAAGLGTFGLNGLIITPKGCAVYLGSVVCDVALTPTPRYENHLAHCLFYRDGSCRRCLERCLAGAISEQGRSNLKCREHSTKGHHELLKKMGKDKNLIGRAPACGLCSTKVPCEARIPDSARSKNRHY